MAASTPTLAALTARTAIPVAPRVAKEGPSAVVRCDLRDTRVYICSAVVLLRLTDNYDYTASDQHVRTRRRCGRGAHAAEWTPPPPLSPCRLQDIRRQYIHNEVLNVEMGFRFDYHLLTGTAPGAAAHRPGVAVMPVTDWASYASATAAVLANRVPTVTPTTAWAAPMLVDAGEAWQHAAWRPVGRGGWAQEGAVVHPTAQLTAGA